MDKSFRRQVRDFPGGANAFACFLCGSCTAGCPVYEIDDAYNPRRIMRMILLDRKEELLASREIWKCNQCHSCVAHCPQDVRFADILRALREIALKEGQAPPSLAKAIETIDIESRKQRLTKIKEVFERGS